MVGLTMERQMGFSQKGARRAARQGCELERVHGTHHVLTGNAGIVLGDAAPRTRHVSCRGGVDGRTARRQEREHPFAALRSGGKETKGRLPLLMLPRDDHGGFPKRGLLTGPPPLSCGFSVSGFRFSKVYSAGQPQP